MNKKVRSTTSEPSQNRSKCALLINATEHLRDEYHKSEVLLVLNTLFVVKTKHIYRNTTKYLKRWKKSSTFKQLLETLFLALKM